MSVFINFYCSAPVLLRYFVIGTLQMSYDDDADYDNDEIELSCADNIHWNMEIADQTVDQFTSFDDVDLLDSGSVSSPDEDKCSASLADVQDNVQCITSLMDMQNDVKCSASLTDVENEGQCSASLNDSVSVPATELHCELSNNSTHFTRERNQIEDSKSDTEAGSCLLSTEFIVSIEKLASAAAHVSPSVDHASSLSSQAVNVSLAVLTLDSDVDSKTDCELTDGEGLEVDLASLQQELIDITADRDKYKALYSQTQQDIDNYQEQILEVSLPLSTVYTTVDLATQLLTYFSHNMYLSHCFHSWY